MSLRSKLLLVSLSILVLPWAGWQFVRQIGELLRQGQEQALLASAEALARGVALRPNALPPAGPSLFVQPLGRAPRLDGDIADWGAASSSLRAIDADASLRMTLGEADDALYLFLEVRDATPERTAAHWPIAGQRDHVRLSLLGRQGLQSLRLANAESGPLLLTADDGSPPPLRVAGHWRERGEGYAIELSLPQGYSLRALGVEVQDADERGAVRQVGTAALKSGGLLPLSQPSPALASALAPLVPAGMRARIVDGDGWRVAEAGAIEGLYVDGAVPVWRRWLYRWLLFAQDPELSSDSDDALRSDAGEVREALSGRTATIWRRDPDSYRLILATAVPLAAGSDRRGALLLERQSDAVLRLTDRAFSGLLGVTLLALLAAALVLFLFAGALSARIRRLRDAADSALDRDGRVRGFAVSNARDEIGDLSRAFARLLDEVAAYTSYLRDLAGKLSHEINTPIAIVRTSLENLEADPQSPEARTYLERARGGIERLGALVRAMSEAGRIEQAIAAAEIEDFDLRRLIADCAEGYRPLLAPRALRLDLPPSAVPFRGAPDLIAQALDKLIDNAIGFCPDDGWVGIALAAEDDGGARLSVANSGSTLPEGLREQLFDSLVSLRGKDRSGAVHLGFGLYVVKLVAELHRGRAEARNLPRGDGVEFTLYLHPRP